MTPTLDNTFGGDGIVTTDIINGNLITVQNDGKIVVAGSSGGNFALARYNADGSLDSSFGSGGIVTSSIITSTSVRVQNDGKIIVGGSTGPSLVFINGEGDFALVRYNADGSVDNSFGQGGKVTTDFEGMRDVVTDLTVQSDGKILATGYVRLPHELYPEFYSSLDFGLVRYNADGSLDTSFGQGGKVITDFEEGGDEFDLPSSIALQSNGKILVTGTVLTNTGSGPSLNFGLVRYNTNGSLDTLFGKAGKVATDFRDLMVIRTSYDDDAYSLKVQSDGKILVGGITTKTVMNLDGEITDKNSDFGLVRYNANGSLDTSFGKGGIVTTDFGGIDDYGNEVMVQSDGKIILAGNVGLARYNPNGSLDNSFGSSGKYAINISDSKLLSDDKILLAGVYNNNFALFRLNLNNTTSKATLGADLLIGTSEADTIDGLAGNDTISGLAGNDKLTGGEGDDSIDGGLGDDTMIGGLGKDIYYANSTNDKVIEDVSADIDSIFSTVTYTLPNNVENLYLQGTAKINGTGNILNNIIHGNSVANRINGGEGNDTLDGGKGDDTMIGGLGNDIYYTDSTNDKVVEKGEDSRDGIDSILTTATYTLPANVENLSLQGTAKINGTGNILDNIITGNSAGNRINGGAGFDTMIGGAGDDTYYVDRADGGEWNNDKVIEKINAGIDSILTNVNDIFTGTYTLPANVENLYLTGSSTNVINGTGNKLNNIITGNDARNRINGGEGNDTLNGSGGNDTLNGGTGNDILNGVDDDTLNSLGNDTLNGGTGDDTYYTSLYSSDKIVETLDAGTDSIYVNNVSPVLSLPYTLPANVENLYLQGTAAINATGNRLNNIITGNRASNRINGGAGNDELIGGLGADHFLYDTNATFTRGSVGVDTITDFVINQNDKIVLDKTTFPEIISANSLISAEFAKVSSNTAAAISGADIVYNTVTGELFYNQNGTATGFGTGGKFAVLSNKPNLTENQFIIQA